MNDAPIVAQVMILVLIMAVGVYTRKRQMITDETRQKLSELLLQVTLPAMVVISFQFDFDPAMLAGAAMILVIAFAAHGGPALLGTLLFRRYPASTRKVLQFVAVFSNCGFMGFPVLESIYGREGVFYGSVYMIAFHVFLWTFGVMLFQGRRDPQALRKAALNPGILAVIVGLGFFGLSIRLPYPLYQALDMIGAMTTPIAMLVVGSILADVDIRRALKGSALYYGTAVRLLLLPLALLLILRPLPMPPLIQQISVLLVAMPAAANTAIFTEAYGADTIFASRIIAFSTLASIVTIPAVLWLV